MPEAPPTNAVGLRIDVESLVMLLEGARCAEAAFEVELRLRRPSR